MPVHHTDDEIDRRHELELDLWRNSPMERRDAESPSHEVANIVNKAQDAEIMYDLIRRFEADFAAATDVLELGGGQGWASCMVKVMHPHTRVTLTDLSPDAVASVHKWERVFGTKVDAATAALSDEIPVETNSQDLLFAYAAAHHFVRHRRTLRELHRVLRPGGRVLYLHEPASPEYIYETAYKRVNRKRPDIPEDVMRIAELGRLAREIGFGYEVDLYPNPAHRGPVETVYYEILARVPRLQRLLPCTANFRLTKR